MAKGTYKAELAKQGDRWLVRITTETHFEEGETVDNYTFETEEEARDGLERCVRYAELQMKFGLITEIRVVGDDGAANPLNA